MVYVHNTNSTERLCRIFDFSFGAFALNKTSMLLTSQADSLTVEFTGKKESMEIEFYLYYV